MEIVKVEDVADFFTSGIRQGENVTLVIKRVYFANNSNYFMTPNFE